MRVARFAEILRQPWEQVIRHFKGRCVYCAQEIAPLALTKDHLIPKANGGRAARNLVPACFGCNNEKGSLTPRQYAAALRAKGRTPAFLLPESLWGGP